MKKLLRYDNAARAARGNSILTGVYAAYQTDESYHEALIDALADLLHSAGPKRFNKALRTARMHYNTERGEMSIGARVILREQRCEDDKLTGTVVDYGNDMVAVRWAKRRDILPGSKAGTTTLEPVARLQVQP